MKRDKVKKRDERKEEGEGEEEGGAWNRKSTLFRIYMRKDFVRGLTLGRGVSRISL